jgi:hypothetical protein
LNEGWKTSIWKQFGAAIEMLEKAIRACPGELWVPAARGGNPEQWESWYIAYHALFWLDLYLWGAVEGFAPPQPFTLDELDPRGVLPERPYTKDELLAYLQHCRKKCQSTIGALTDEAAARHCTFPWGELSFGELLLDNMRHVTGHAAELSLMIGQTTGSGPGWVSRASSEEGESGGRGD